MKPKYEGWKVFFIVGDPTIKSDYQLDRNILTLQCEDSYLHLLKKTIFGFKIALQLVPYATGILKCGDDIVFNESNLVDFLCNAEKHDYMGIPGDKFVPLTESHYDSWIVDYYKRHPEDFENPLHRVPSMDVVKTLCNVPTIQAASGPLTYFSRKSCDLLIEHMEGIQWNVLKEVQPYGYPYIIEEPGISFMLYPHNIHVHSYQMFTESRELFQLGKHIGFHTNSYKWEGPKKVCIIGAGWYGCHAARLLRKHGFYVHILEKEGVFAGASSKNQNRLHLGYHYPRSPETIQECKEGHEKFLLEYGDCVVPFRNNYYCIHKNSRISVDEYRRIFKDETHDEASRVIETHDLEDTMFRVSEKFIDNNRITKRMKLELESYIELCDSPSIRESAGKVYANDIEYDYVLNCTNNQYVPFPIPYSPVYETVCSFLYKISFDEPTAFTVMDGSFFSIFPYDIEKNIYTVTHVVHSVVSRDKTPSTTHSSIEDARKNIELEMFGVFPTLREKAVYQGYFLSNKTKYDFTRDDRSLRWFRKDNYFSFSGGKITGIFEMEKVIQQTILWS